MPQLPPLRGWLCVQYIIHYDYSRLFPDILRIYPIIPEYSLILLTTYYARNYAGIIDACLPSKVTIACFGFCLLRYANKTGLHVI